MLNSNVGFSCFVITSVRILIGYWVVAPRSCFAPESFCPWVLSPWVVLPWVVSPVSCFAPI